MKKGVAMVLCRSMGSVSSEDEFTRRSVAAKMFNFKLNEILELALYNNLASYFTLPTNKCPKIWEILKG